MSNLQPSWKQEVNQRLAAHKSRKGQAVTDRPSAVDAGHAATAAAARAAARVAARFAQAPSYSQMLADEARAAVRAAEVASQAALQAQAAAESVLAGLDARSGANPAWKSELVPSHAEEAPSTTPVKFFDPFFDLVPAAPSAPPISQPALDPESLEIRWEPDMPVRSPEPAAARVQRIAGRYEIPLEPWREAPPMEGEPHTVEPVQPIHANLIEFPRELVATRKARPRMAEGPFAAPAEPWAQLSIFEVDPGAISIEPEAVGSVATPAAPHWSNLKLDAEPVPELEEETALAPREITVHLAPLGLRVMAALVDGSLILGAVLMAAMATLANLQHPPAIKTAEVTAGLALLVIGVLYQAFFFSMIEATPGMRYAGISLCTLDDEVPTGTQMRRRLVALVLSLLPVGLGVLWAIFDEDHLSWHDRLSRTYQRKG
jgi:uncharacterized RDD family membrane protein YckC